MVDITCFGRCKHAISCFARFSAILTMWCVLLFFKQVFAGGYDGAQMQVVFPKPAQTISNRYHGKSLNVHLLPLTQVTVNSGSLRANIERIAKNCGWSRVVWRASHDYRWIGHTTISSYQRLPGVLKKLLADYPLQAAFYQGNHVLLIRPRVLHDET